MRISNPPGHSGLPGLPSANDRFKANAPVRTAWSLAAATGVHVLLFAFWPAVDAPQPWQDRSTAYLEFEVLALGQGVAPGQAALPEPSPVGLASGQASEEGGDDEGDEEEAGPEDAGEGEAGPVEPGIGDRPGGPAGGTAPGGSAALWDRVRRDAPPPSVVEPEPAPPEDEADPVDPAEEAEAMRIGGNPSDLDAVTRLDRDGLDLDRLAGVSPELVLTAPSDWILLRNPSEVDAFLRGFYARGELDSGRNGSVLVTIWVDEAGSVEWAEIARSSGRTDLDEVALELFSGVAAFRPARDRGVRVPLSVQFWVNFPWVPGP